MLVHAVRYLFWGITGVAKPVYRPLTVGSSRFMLDSHGFSSIASQPDAETMQFKTETKKLLNIVAKSLYTDKEVFIRELISNSSDALEKLRFLTSTGGLTSLADETEALYIRLDVDEKNRTVTIMDTGVGMTRQELIDNLGTIAKSGSREFVVDEALNASDKASNIIGQFGVGFYSTFVVADKVQVFSKSCDPSKDSVGHVWESDGLGTFTVSESENVPRGTRIVLHLKDDAVEFSNPGTVQKTAQKFSNFVDFPIKLNNIATMKVEEINKQDAVWMKASSSEQEHIDFYRYLGNSSYGEPMYTLQFQSDAPLSIKSVFYVPEEAPNRWFQQSPDVGVALHSRRVLVKKHANDVIPKWLHWVRGVIDCEDMPMNISRESMQDTALLKKLSMAVVRRLLTFLDNQSRKDKKKYNMFWQKYATYIKAGLLEDQQQNVGLHKDHILKLLRFDTSKGGDLISLEEYVACMPSTQQNIYYFTASSRTTAMQSPYMEPFKHRNVPVLVLIEDIDEFVINYIDRYQDKKLVSIDAESGVEAEILTAGKDVKPCGTSYEDLPALSVENKKNLEEFFRETLGKRVNSVRFTSRLLSSSAVVTSQITPHMRRMMRSIMQQSQSGNEGLDEMDSLEAVPCSLELNPDHHVVKMLAQVVDNNRDLAGLAVRQIYDNACIAAGMLDDPRAILNRLNQMVEVTVYQGAGKRPPSFEAATSSSATEETEVDQPLEVEKETFGRVLENNAASTSAGEAYGH